jgi:hypothetical protein
MAAAASVSAKESAPQAHFVEPLLKLLKDGRDYLKRKEGNFGVKEQLVFNFITTMMMPDSRLTLRERKSAFDKENAMLIMEARARPGLYQGFSTYWKAVDEFFVFYGSSISSGVIRFEEKDFLGDLMNLLHRAGSFLLMASDDRVVQEVQEIVDLLRKMLFTPDARCIGLRVQEFLNKEKEGRVIKIRELLLPKDVAFVDIHLPGMPLWRLGLPFLLLKEPREDSLLFRRFLAAWVNFVTKHGTQVISLELLKRVPLSRLIDGLMPTYQGSESNFERDLQVLLNLGCAQLERIYFEGNFSLYEDQKHFITELTKMFVTPNSASIGKLYDAFISPIRVKRATDSVGPGGADSTFRTSSSSVSALRVDDKTRRYWAFIGNFVEKYRAQAPGVVSLSLPILCEDIGAPVVTSAGMTETSAVKQVLFPVRLRSLIKRIQNYLDLPDVGGVSKEVLQHFLNKLIDVSYASVGALRHSDFFKSLGKLKPSYTDFFKENEVLLIEAEAEGKEAYKKIMDYIEHFVEEFPEQVLRREYLDVLGVFRSAASASAGHGSATAVCDTLASSAAGGAGAGAGAASSVVPA